MKSSEVIEKIKVMLGMEVKKLKFETKKTLVDGTEVYSEGEIAIGEALFVITEDGLVQAPEGTHETTDGFTVVVDANGVITSIEPVNGEELEQPKEEVVENAVENVITEEIVGAIVQALQPMIEEMKEIKKTLGNYKEKMEKLSKEPAGNPVVLGKEVAQNEDKVFTRRMELLKELKVS
jgi:hypothetical protein